MRVLSVCPEKVRKERNKAGKQRKKRNAKIKEANLNKSGYTQRAHPSPA